MSPQEQPAYRAEPSWPEEKPGGLGRQGRLSFVASGLTLAVTLVSGVLIARALGARGRGEIAAITAAPQFVGWIAALGCAQAVGYHQARHPKSAPRLIGTWLVILIGLATVGIVAGELLLPTLLSAQSHDAYELARLFMPTLTFLLLGELAYGVLLGDQDFGFFNLMRVATPMAIAFGYFVLWQFGALSVKSALVVLALVGAVGGGFAVFRAFRRHGIGRPSASLGKTTVWYGIRAHGTNVGGLMNARLDMIMIPAFLSAATVGRYSVATNISWIVVSISGGLAALVGPAATRQGGSRGVRTVIRGLQATLAVAVVLAAGIAIFGGLAVRLVYGGEFAGSVTPLRLLLPGCVLYAATGVLISGLYSRNRPLTAALAQGAGVVVTAAGLSLFLRSGGIVAAAIVSSVAYALAFVVAVLLYKREAGLEWSAFLPSVRELMSWRRLMSKTQPEAT